MRIVEIWQDCMVCLIWADININMGWHYQAGWYQSQSCADCLEIPRQHSPFHFLCNGGQRGRFYVSNKKMFFSPRFTQRPIWTRNNQTRISLKLQKKSGNISSRPCATHKLFPPRMLITLCCVWRRAPGPVIGDTAVINCSRQTSSPSSSSSSPESLVYEKYNVTP